jgi:hypothetical protein
MPEISRFLGIVITMYFEEQITDQEGEVSDYG